MSEKVLPVVKGVAFYGYSKVSYEKVEKQFKQKAKELVPEIIGTIEVKLPGL